MRALLLAVKSQIQGYLGVAGGSDADSICDVTDQGQPKGSSGQVFYGIVGGSFGNDAQEYRNDTFDVKVIITLRADYCPQDREGTELLLQANAAGNANSGGLWARAEALATLLQRSYAVNAAANATIGATAPAAGFVEPLLFRRATYLGAKGPEWFGAEPGDDAHSGLAIEVSFDRCRYVDGT